MICESVNAVLKKLLFIQMFAGQRAKNQVISVVDEFYYFKGCRRLRRPPYLILLLHYIKYCGLARILAIKLIILIWEL